MAEIPITFKEVCNLVRIFIDEKPTEGPDRMGRMPGWLERMDEVLADIRSELANAANDDDQWGDYEDMPRPRFQPSVTK